jgi:hypothetical protein
MNKLTELLEQAEALAAKATVSPYQAGLRGRTLGALELSRQQDAWEAARSKPEAKPVEAKPAR